MADILIKGLALPTGDDDVKIIINSDGSVHRIIGWAISEKMNATAIELPSHGALKDADAIRKWLSEQHEFSMVTTCKIDKIIADSPTIAEASTSEGEETR